MPFVGHPPRPDLPTLLPPHESHTARIRGDVTSSLLVPEDKDSGYLLNEITQRCGDLASWKLKPEHRGWVVRELVEIWRTPRLRPSFQEVLKEAIQFHVGQLSREMVNDPVAQQIWSELMRLPLSEFTAPPAAKSPEN